MFYSFSQRSDFDKEAQLISQSSIVEEWNLVSLITQIKLPSNFLFGMETGLDLFNDTQSRVQSVLQLIK